MANGQCPARLQEFLCKHVFSFPSGLVKKLINSQSVTNSVWTNVFAAQFYVFQTKVLFTSFGAECFEILVLCNVSKKI